VALRLCFRCPGSLFRQVLLSGPFPFHQRRRTHRRSRIDLFLQPVLTLRAICNMPSPDDYVGERHVVVVARNPTGRLAFTTPAGVRAWPSGFSLGGPRGHRLPAAWSARACGCPVSKVPQPRPHLALPLPHRFLGLAPCQGLKFDTAMFIRRLTRRALRYFIVYK
jgi:hypothetical protein